MINFVLLGAEVLEQKFLGGFEHQVFVMYHVVRIHAVVSPVRKRLAERIHVKYLNTGFAHGPASVRVIELYTLKDRKKLFV